MGSAGLLAHGLDLIPGWASQALLDGEGAPRAELPRVLEVSAVQCPVHSQGSSEYLGPWPRCWPAGSLESRP